MTPDDRDFDELARLWRDQEVDADTWNTEEILMNVKRKSERFDRTIRRRDAVEAIAGALVIGVFGWVSWQTPGIIPKLGALFASGCVVFALWKMYRVQRRNRGAREDLPLTARLKQEISRVEDQIRLLRRVVSWYVLPLAAGGTVWATTATVPVAETSLALAAASIGVVLAGSVVIFSLVGYMVWKLNQRAVERQLIPYRDELRALLDQASNGESCP
ncbi:hypothetical protein ABI59_18240 [Acidobacteria bacterium Mor1]|nr:hypothetical protein ABI59_18240 [Acidobacteria bacterium Mor1]